MPIVKIVQTSREFYDEKRLFREARAEKLADLPGIPAAGDMIDGYDVKAVFWNTSGKPVVIKLADHNADDHFSTTDFIVNNWKENGYTITEDR